MSSDAPEDSHWVRFAEWSADSRLRFGLDSYSHVVANLGGVIESVPTHLRAAVRELLQKQVGRGPIASSPSEECATLPSYLGGVPNRLLLEGDLSVTWGESLAAVASDVAFWLERTGEVSDASGDSFQLTFQPNSPTEHDLRLSRLKYFSGVRVLIVGGQVVQRLIATLESDLGLKNSAINWLPSEKKKAPRGLRAAVHGLVGGKSVVICLTGQIGHSTSGSLKALCRNSDVVYLECKTPATLLEQLKALSDV